TSPTSRRTPTTSCTCATATSNASIRGDPAGHGPLRGRREIDRLARMLRAIIFDFDGVVVDSEPVHYAAIRDVARTLGIELTYDQYLRDLIGYDDRDAFRHLLTEAGKVVTDEEVAALKDAKQQAFESLAAE